MQSWLKDFVHNCIVHPMLPFLPTEFGDRLHERNGKWAFGEDDAPTPIEHFVQLEGTDITAHELMNIATADSEGAELLRVVCNAWTGEDAERAGPNGPRIGTIYVENNDGLLEIRLVTRMAHPEAMVAPVAA